MAEYMAKGRSGKLAKFPPLDVYLVTDRLLAAGRSEEDIVREALAAGVRWVQYREKNLAARQQVETAERLCRLVKAAGGCFLVNDRVDIAVAVGADGVHLGQEDMPLAFARRILGEDKVIGVSVSTVEEALRAEREGADYLGAGAVFATATKPEAGGIGLEGLKAIREAVSLPLVAIGGITLENASAVIEAGADGIAVVSAIVRAAEVRRAAQQLLEKVRAARREAERKR